MTMMQKIQAKKSKKGFTLVELVIVIAILAILAAIAIPVITTTINSSKVSTMKSDGATVAMLVKEAVNNNLAHLSTTKYGAKDATDDSLTVQEVLEANDIKPDDYSKGSSDDDFYNRHIGGKDYQIAWVVSSDKVLTITTDYVGSDTYPDDAEALENDTLIQDLADAINE